MKALSLLIATLFMGIAISFGTAAVRADNGSISTLTPSSSPVASATPDPSATATPVATAAATDAPSPTASALPNTGSSSGSLAIFFLLFLGSTMLYLFLPKLKGFHK